METNTAFLLFNRSLPRLPPASCPAALPQSPMHSLVAHHEHLQLLDVVDQELPEARGQHVLRLLIAAVADVGHQDLALEPPANSVIDPSRLTPVALKKCRKYAVMTRPV